MVIKNRVFTLFPFLLVLLEVATYLANDMYLPALPQITQDLNTTSDLAQLTLSSWFFGSASLQLVLGPLSDRVGRRPVLLGGGLIFILSTLGCTFATNIYFLIFARFFQGCAVCSVVTAGYSSIHELHAQKQAIQILAVMSSIALLAPAFGPLAGGTLLLWVNWRWLFVLLVIWALITMFVLWFKMPESNPADKRHPFILKTLLKNYIAILGNKTFMLNTLIFCFGFLVLIAWIAAGPFLVMQTFKFNTFVFGIAQALVFGSLIAGAQFVKFNIEKIKPQKLINVGLIISTLGSVAAAILAKTFPHHLFYLVFSLMLFAFGANLAVSPSHRIAIESCDEPMGARMAIFSTLMGLFGVLGSLLVSLTYTSKLAWFGQLMVIMILLTWVIRWWERRGKVKPRER